MKKPLPIAFLGHGAIAGYVIDQIRDHPDIRVAAVLARAPSMAKARQFADGLCPVITSSHQVPAGVDLVFESADLVFVNVLAAQEQVAPTGQLVAQAL